MKAVLLGPAPLNPTTLDLPLYSPRVSAGQSRFASAAQGYELDSLDLNQRYIVNPPATFLVKCEGDSMLNAGIMPGAVLVVDRSIKPKSSQVIVAEVDGEFLVKTLYKRGNVIRLLSENPAYPAIEFKEGQELVVWGVVTAVINEFYSPYFRAR